MHLLETDLCILKKKKKIKQFHKENVIGKRGNHPHFPALVLPLNSEFPLAAVRYELNIKKEVHSPVSWVNHTWPQSSVEICCSDQLFQIVVYKAAAIMLMNSQHGKKMDNS